MWTRAGLKQKAKEVLRISYWKAFLVSIVIAIAGANGSGGSSGGGGRSSWRNNGGIDPFTGSISQPDQSLMMLVTGVVLIVAVIVVIFVLSFRIFLGYPLEVGGRRYFVQSAQRDINMNYLGYSFSKERYADIVKTMLWKGLLNFLWFLLLIIPGIVKAYGYSMVPYILADNPNIGYRRAIELSEQMTNGQKMDMFVLDLSFIGWYLLGAMALGIGVLFVMPYENATKGELYMVLRQNAIDQGMCTRGELRIDPQRQQIEPSVY